MYDKTAVDGRFQPYPTRFNFTINLPDPFTDESHPYDP